MDFKGKGCKNKGITLIALVITIIVLLILAGVTISMLSGDNSAPQKATEAAQKDAISGAKDEIAMEVQEALLDYYNNTYVKGNVTEGASTQSEVAKAAEKAVNSAKSKNKQLLLDSGVTDNTITLKTKSYTVTGTETVNGYTVSTSYRLYYVDFDNKYGDGVGTIYLKADSTNNQYALQLDETSSAEDSNVRIKQLNPSLYASGVNPPTSENMKAVVWLLNENNWGDLKKSTKIKDNQINYIVGSPSLEMMIDSYNTKYVDVLTGTEKPDCSNIPEGERRKLFYKYIYGQSGYLVGPCQNEHSEYYYYATSIWPDTAIGTMYTTGDSSCSYWLASPCGDYWDEFFMIMVGRSGIDEGMKDSSYSFCPLVSLKTSVQLNLEN